MEIIVPSAQQPFLVKSYPYNSEKSKYTVVNTDKMLEIQTNCRTYGHNVGNSDKTLEIWI